MKNAFEEIPKNKGFEEQFRNIEQFDVAGGKAEVVDIKLADEPKTDVPLFLAPAWACTVETYKPVLETLAETDRRVLGINHPRFGGDMSTAPEEAVNNYSFEELRKALNIIDVIKQKDIEKVDVITHSEGAINTAIAAMLHPEKFRNIVFYAPAGLIGEDTFTRLLKGFSQQSKPAESLADIKIDDETTNAAWEALKYLAKNPVRGIKETIDVSNSQIHDVIRYLHE
ncbi:alpha/beta fold hydrolase [Candidatus Nomurabacteria bacterium]|nr:alpha/beta fold hydrolase [Candidatus Nomurabacteria bacterium]